MATTKKKSPAITKKTQTKQPEQLPTVRTISRLNKKTLMLICVAGFLLLVVAAAPGYYFYTEYSKAQLQLKNPTKAAQMELEETIKKVSKHILLPNEAPTMATVSDVSKLKEQVFFANAKNGDKVLIFSQSKKAVLYRPENDILVEVSALEVAEKKAAVPTTTPTVKSAQIVPVKVAIYNGTTTAGLGGEIEEEITAKLDNVSVSDVANAGKRDYVRSIVIDISGKSKETVTSLSKLLKAPITNLPNTEKKPAGADILIIIGDDKNSNVTPSPTSEVTPQPTETPEE